MEILHQTIGKALSDIAGVHPRRSALVHPETGSGFTHAALFGGIERAARGFLRLGIGAGDKVALWAPNVPEWLLAFLGLARIGAITVPIDPAATPEGLNYILGQSESRAIITAAEGDDDRMSRLARQAQTDVPALREIITIGDASASVGISGVSWERLMAEGEGVPPGDLQAACSAVRPEDPVAIMYTSGTTGAPKGVVLNHLGLIHKSLHATERQGIGPEDRLCLFFPLFHMFGNTCIALAGLLRGASLIMACRRFDPLKILNSVAAEKCTAIYGSPSMLISLIDHPRFCRDEWVSLKKGIIGGAPCPMELMRRIVEEIGVSGITVAWGITEASSWVTMTHPDDRIDLRVSTIGRPLPCSEVKIVDPLTGEGLAPGRPGELCTRGFLMTEYFKMPAATAAAIDRDGWLHTGDLGTTDAAGYVKITGRLKEVIARDGVNIFPVEVEEVIYSLPEVSEVQVFGFPHLERGMEAAAWIKLKAGCRISIETVADHVALRLPAEMRPRHYKLVSGFPMTASGKIQKFKLSEMAQTEYGSGA